jgi:GNAT superfamily N-acetyltransferase
LIAANCKKGAGSICFPSLFYARPIVDMTKTFTYRIATLDDLDALRTVMARAIAQNQSDFLTPEQVAVSSRTMGLDTQLVSDGTYFIVEREGRIAGCGGWSFRGTLFGGDKSLVERDPAPLDPTTGVAKIRAMYTDPDFVRQGVGSYILELGEAAARAAGFKRIELMGTAAGIPLYERRGYVASAPVELIPVDGVEVPHLRMEKQLAIEP